MREMVIEAMEKNTLRELKNHNNLDRLLREHYPVVIIGAGPAGLTAAFELLRQGIQPCVIEKDEMVGGLARTEIYKDYRFDVGGHRFFTKNKKIEQLWNGMMGRDFLRVSRLSSIYYRGRYFKYPIEPFDVIKKLGLLESIMTGFSYIKARLIPHKKEDSFEQYVTNRFGKRLYHAFFKTYTEKIWGIPCHLIHAEWASQRIQGLSIISAISHTLFRNKGIKSLIKEFGYPMLGPGMMWERFHQSIKEGGGKVETKSVVTRFCRAGSRIDRVYIEKNNHLIDIKGDYFISSMPLVDLVRSFYPQPPKDVLNAANCLHYRAFILVALIISYSSVFPDNWIYIHSPDVKVGRIQNFKNWSEKMVPDAGKTSLGMEFFCDEGDALWNLPDSELIALATNELETMGLVKKGNIDDGVVIRQPKAYPVYDNGYREHLGVIRKFIDSIENLQVIGRNGMHRYNNQDHSMLTGLLAARNVAGENHDLWQINTEASHHEDSVTVWDGSGMI
jgi:protoporphyrinogen oxidase